MTRISNQAISSGSVGQNANSPVTNLKGLVSRSESDISAIRLRECIGIERFVLCREKCVQLRGTEGGAIK